MIEIPVPTETSFVQFMTSDDKNNVWFVSECHLNYQNRRPDYVEAFFNVINWAEVSRRYDLAK